ncbi:MAG: hypothetical protein ACM30E_07700 [Nitrososphaerales archaeon]
MLAITCDKCRRRYTATDEELRVYMQQAEGKKYAQVLCPHCGKPSKVAADRIHQALRFSPTPAEGAASPQAEMTAGGDEARQGPAEEANPPA